MALRFYNTLTQTVEPFTPLADNTVRMYTCRPTVYNFVHIGLLHIGLNMWCLWDFGSFCESLYGTWTYGAIYLLSGVSGGVACLVFNPHAVIAGASGAIFGLVGALMASLYLGEFSAPRALIQARLRSVAIFAVYSLIFGFVAGGISTPADAALVMQLGAEGVFVGSGIFKSEDPAKMANAIVQATTFFDDAKKIAEVSKGLGAPMRGIALEEIPDQERLAVRGW